MTMVLSCDDIALLGSEGPTAVAIGTFDGVHTGHNAVLATLSREAHERGLRPVALTFNRHPLDVVAPERVPALLSLPQQRHALVEQQNCSCATLHFDERMASVTAREWMETLRDHGKTRLLIIGYDNTFGSDGVTMSVADFKRLGAELGIDVMEAPLVNGVSSSIIRRLLLEGDADKAMDLLGRPYQLEGVVVHGQALGRKLGWPTANIQPDPRVIIPGKGVYAAVAVMHDGNRLPACVNIGNRPTIGPANPPTVEAHLFGNVGSLYGLTLRIDFYHRLRDEKKFASFDALSEAIAADARATLDYFRNIRPDAITTGAGDTDPVS